MTDLSGMSDEDLQALHAKLSAAPAAAPADLSGMSDKQLKAMSALQIAPGADPNQFPDMAMLEARNGPGAARAMSAMAPIAGVLAGAAPVAGPGIARYGMQAGKAAIDPKNMGFYLGLGGAEEAARHIIKYLMGNK